jgi:hypothetical protein
LARFDERHRDIIGVVRLTRIAAVLVFVALTSSAPALAPPAVAAAGPQLRSVGPLAFGPGGVMYAADSLAGKIYALDLGPEASGGAPGTADIDDLNQKIAAMLGTDTAQIVITDLAVDARTRNSFVSVLRGQGPDAQPALLRVDGAGKISVINTAALQFTSVDLPNLARNAGGRNRRVQAITDLNYADGRVWASGLSNEEFASRLWSVSYPFTQADRGMSLEIYHGNHRRLETRAPMYAFVPYAIDHQPYLIGGYLCTPLVKFSVASLQQPSVLPHRGTTIGEFGAGNRPIDMIVYRKDGKDFILMSNTNNGVMKIPTETFATAEPIDHPVNDTGGVPFETVETMDGVLQLDLFDATHSVVLVGTSTESNLQVVELP